MAIMLMQSEQLELCEKPQSQSESDMELSNLQQRKVKTEGETCVSICLSSNLPACMHTYI